MHALALALVVAGAPVSSANDLNREGLRLYQQKKYAQALEKFRAAVEADDGSALGHYNYAATLGVLRKQGKLCEFSAYNQEILGHLERSIVLDPERRKRVVSDADFDEVRGTIRYLRLFGKDPARAGDVRAILEAVTWYGPISGLGMYGSVASIDFRSGGKASVWLLVNIKDGETKQKTVAASWKLDGVKVVLDLAEPYEGARKVEAHLTPEGTLVIDSGNLPGPFGDERVQCDA